MLRPGLLLLASSAFLSSDGNGTVLVERSTFSLGGRTFVRTVTNRTTHYAGEDAIMFGLNGGPAKQRTTSSSLQNPNTADERAFNRQVQRIVADTDHETEWVGPVDSTIALDIVGSAPGVILAREDLYQYPKGGAASATWSRAFSWSLTQRRRLTAADFFDPKSGWETALARPLLFRMYEEPVEPSDRYQRLDPAQFPRISKAGLCLKFEENGNERFVTDQARLLPWETLRPYLRKTLPLDPRKIEVQDFWLECPP
jgi:hypothetical protein